VGGGGDAELPQAVRLAWEDGGFQYVLDEAKQDHRCGTVARTRRTSMESCGDETFCLVLRMGYLVQWLALEESLAVEAAPGSRLLPFSSAGGSHTPTEGFALLLSPCDVLVGRENLCRPVGRTRLTSQEETCEPLPEPLAILPLSFVGFDSMLSDP
jgi:hypothetical protein